MEGHYWGLVEECSMHVFVFVFVSVFVFAYVCDSVRLETSLYLRVTVARTQFPR